MTAPPSAYADVLGRYCGAFADALAGAGVEHVCLCPGSRSTPLALTFARHPRIKVWTHLDERSCAYFALGMAKAWPPRPVAVLCSSGTAAVNFAPAVVEASHSRVPLIVLTADRPPELRDLGANQTIDQLRLYGGAARWFVEMPLPEASETMLRYVRTVAARAVATALGGRPGPVHLNFPFREPLLPNATPPEAPAAPPAPSIEPAVAEPRAEDVASLARELEAARCALVVVGPQPDPELLVPLEALTRSLDLPVLVDALSQLRAGMAGAIGSYDSFLRDARTAAALEPDVILRFGGVPTSKPLQTYLQRHVRARQVLVSPDGSVDDPDLTAHAVIHAEPRRICERLIAALDDARLRAVGDWQSRWWDLEQRTRDVLAGQLDGEATVSEPGAFWRLAALLPAAAALFAGISMPVRDLDSFYPRQPSRHVRFYANRGASGIDGVVSTALGVAALSEGPTVLVIGDLSFYHDMNGLIAARRFGLSATIILLNNDGGGIFSFLSQNDDQEHFEALFGTPHGLDFRPVAALYGLGWQTVETPRQYDEALAASLTAPGVQVIEVKTDRAANLKLHQRIWQAVAAAVAPPAAK